MVLSTITRSQLKNNNNVVNLRKYKLNLTAFVPDSSGNKMVVGDEYEMYAPIAERAYKELGVKFYSKDYKFIYLGVMDGFGKEPYIASKDVTYDPECMPDGHYKGALAVAALYGGAYPVCPCFVAAKYVRKATD